MNTHLIRWIAVTLLPLLAVLWFTLFPASDPTDYLINGIILSCLCVFLLKAVLFAMIGAHLKQQHAQKRQALLQLIPLIFFTIFIIWYFVR